MSADNQSLTEPRRRPHKSRLEYLGWLLVIPPTLALAWSVSRNDGLEWSVVGEYLFAPSIVRGIGITLMLTAVSMVLGTILGMLLAVFLSSRSKLLQNASRLFIWFFRGTPLLVQLIFWFNLAALYPRIGINGMSLQANDIITPLTAAILGLALNEAAYMAEIVRGGLLSVPTGQTEAAQTLGLRPSHVMYRVVMPQAMRVIVPMIGNQTISMLKNTSLVSVLGLSELLHSAQLVYGRTYQTIPLLVVACLWYLVMTTVLSIGQHFIERAYGRGYSRTVTAEIELPDDSTTDKVAQIGSLPR